MLFNSFAFLFGFLPWALLGFWLLDRYENARLWFLCIASVAFYSYWDWRFTPLLVGSIIVNWLAAQIYFSTRRRFVLVLAIAANLLSLAIFKYLGFFSEIAAELTGQPIALARLVLPLGISFFTFHNIIYLADLLRRGAPRYNFRDYTLYITLFPQILAGPLVRHNEIIPQFRERPLRDGWDMRIARGIAFLLFGLCKKIFLADSMARLADPVFAQAAHNQIGVGEAWTAALAFPLQIYFDFSGYSDMAIGIALMLGFVLPYNFDVPYRAANLAQFWRRWHMTLMRFLRDYVYIPLGGSRRGTPRQIVNILITFFLSGLWHGAGWTFVLWGVLHGLGLVAGIIWRRFGKPMPRSLAWILLIAFLILTWVFFRAPSLAAAQAIFAAMAGQGSLTPVNGIAAIMIAAAFALIGPSSQKLIEKCRPAAWIAPLGAVATIAAFFQINRSPAYEFIYFHF